MEQQQQHEKKQSPRGGGKQVHFKKMCEVKLIPCIEEYSQVEQMRIWMSPLEFEHIRAECLETCIKLNGGVPENDDLCYRGLVEWKLNGCGKRKKQQRMLAEHVVLLEQEKQWEENIIDPERIRDAYHRVAHKNGVEAFRRAIRDSEVAFKIYCCGTKNSFIPAVQKPTELKLQLPQHKNQRNIPEVTKPSSFNLSRCQTAARHAPVSRVAVLQLDSHQGCMKSRSVAA